MKTCIIVPWFNYWRTKNSEEFSFLMTKLEEEGFKVYLFDYEERPDDLDDLLKRLDDLINSIKVPEIDLIGFSLGSHIIVKYIQKYNTKKVKKSLLCFPLVLGSKFFRIIYFILPFWRKNSGKVIHDASFEKLDPSLIPKNIKVGIIRGSKKVNRRFMSFLAQFLLFFNRNDGLFTISETEFGDYEKLTLPVGHYNSFQSPILINNIINFLKNSSFD